MTCAKTIFQPPAYLNFAPEMLSEIRPHSYSISSFANLGKLSVTKTPVLEIEKKCLNIC